MDDVHLRRRLTAVLLADVVGYSRLMSADEQGTHRRLAGYVNDLIEPAVVQHRGRPVRSMGDGMLVEFDSALDAVQCAVDIQHGLASRQPGDTERPIQLRIGVNTGDVIVDERDIYGNSINIAARLEALAEPGQIYVTRSVHDQLLGYPGFAFQDRGRRRVKNIDQPIQVFRVEYDPAAQLQSAPRGLKTLVLRWCRAAFHPNPRSAAIVAMLIAIAAMLGLGTPPVWRGSAPLPPRASIVVMPFSNFSGDPQQGYLADAITDEVTTDLARLKGIFVIAPSTAFTFKGRSVDAREVGKECNVRYLLEGSIIRDGNKIETNVQLIDTETGGHVWADRFQNEFSDLFELQEAVTGRIAASLHLQLVRAENRRTVAERRTDPDAYDMRLRAMAYLVNQFTPENTLAARRDLEKSLALDPNSAEAWSELAYVLMIDFFRSWNNAGKEIVLQAKEAVQKAYEIDRSVALAHLADGKIREIEGDFRGEIGALDEALQLDPNLSVAYVHKANALILLGRVQDAPALLTKAINLSPRDPDIGLFYWFMGRAYFVMNDYDNAIHWLEQSVRERPTTWFSWAHLISAYALTGRLTQHEAQAALREYHEKFYNWPLAKIKDFYTRGKYRDAPPNLKASLQELFRGLQVAKQTAGFS